MCKRARRSLSRRRRPRAHAPQRALSLPPARDPLARSCSWGFVERWAPPLPPPRTRAKPGGKGGTRGAPRIASADSAPPRIISRRERESCPRACRRPRANYVRATDFFFFVFLFFWTILVYVDTGGGWTDAFVFVMVGIHRWIRLMRGRFLYRFDITWLNFL